MSDSEASFLTRLGPVDPAGMSVRVTAEALGTPWNTERVGELELLCDAPALPNLVFRSSLELRVEHFRREEIS